MAATSTRVDRTGGFDAVLSDGAILHLRPICPGDRWKLAAFHQRLSPETQRLRFFTPHPRLSDAEIKRFTEVDHRDREALVATDGEDIVAVGRYDRLDGSGEAEIAFVVEDEYQGRGLATLLLEHLASSAREQGIERFVADALAENARMLRVFQDAGFPCTRTFDSGTVHVTFPIVMDEP